MPSFGRRSGKTGKRSAAHSWPSWRYGDARLAIADAPQREWIFNEHGELIIAELSPEGYKQISRGKLVNRTPFGMPSRIGGVTWAHPAFAYKHVIVRNDGQLVAADLSAE